MTLGAEPEGPDTPLLQIELAECSDGCLAMFRGDLVAETTGALWGVEPILVNEARVALDLSGVTSVDRAGLEAALGMVGVLHTTGGRISIWGEAEWVGPISAGPRPG